METRPEENLNRKLKPVEAPKKQTSPALRDDVIDEQSTTISGRVSVPDPEVPEKPVRRKFSAEYKLRILREADDCTESGQIGALLRREGIYSSLLARWRRQRDKGILGGLAPKKRGRKAKEKNPLSTRVAQLERQNRRLKKQIAQAEIIIDVQKKVSTLLGIQFEDPDEEENN